MAGEFETEQNRQLQRDAVAVAAQRNRRFEMDAVSRAIEIQKQRLEYSRARQERDRIAAATTTIYRGQGKYAPIGADGGSRPRGVVTTGGIAVGAVAPVNGGLVGGMDTPDTGWSPLLADVNMRLARVAQERGPQAGDGRPTPNELDESDPETDVGARYVRDRYFQKTTGQTWQWASAGPPIGPFRWEVAKELDHLPVSIESPVAQQYPAWPPDPDDVPRRLLGIVITNRNPDGSPATTGAATVLLNGVAVEFGVSVLMPGDYLALDITTPGGGVLLAKVSFKEV